MEKMAEDSKIQWTENTWNPWQGCRKVSQGCKYCYMYRDKEKFGQDPGGEYASLSHIAQEIEYAHQLFKQNKKWPVFNVTERALEETASEITKIVAARMGLPDTVLF